MKPICPLCKTELAQLEVETRVKKLQHHFNKLHYCHECEQWYRVESNDMGLRYESLEMKSLSDEDFVDGKAPWN